MKLVRKASKDGHRNAAERKNAAKSLLGSFTHPYTTEDCILNSRPFEYPTVVLLLFVVVVVVVDGDAAIVWS